MSDLSWAATMRFVHERARECCEYCQTCQKLTGQAMHVEHIAPDGGDAPDNLCLSCPNCNLSKSAATQAPDPMTGQMQALFNPRKQQWAEHFEWDTTKTHIIGRSAIGRATVERLRINSERMIIARSIWVKAGEHPPGKG
jgi:HNH endonuclease